MIRNETTERPDYFIGCFIFSNLGWSLRRGRGYAKVYQKSLGLSLILHRLSQNLILILLIPGVIAEILGCLFRKKLPFFQPRIAAAVILITTVLIRARE